MNCSICGYDKTVIDHHLSYEPEIITRTRKRCHWIIHGLARLSQEQRNIINEWIGQYGHLWKDGDKKYHKSNECKLKKLNSDQIIKKMANMERQIKLIRSKENVEPS